MVFYCIIELIKCDFFFVFVYDEMNIKMNTLIIHSFIHLNSKIFVCIESELIERSFIADDKIICIQRKIQLNSYSSGFRGDFGLHFSSSLVNLT